MVRGPAGGILHVRGPWDRVLAGSKLSEGIRGLSFILPCSEYSYD